MTGEITGSSSMVRESCRGSAGSRRWRILARGYRTLYIRQKMDRRRGGGSGTQSELAPIPASVVDGLTWA